MTENDQSLKLKEGAPEGWSALTETMLTVQKPEPVKKKKPESKVVHGFRLYRDESQEKILLQIGMKPTQKGSQILLTSIVRFLNRMTGKEIQIGIVDGWECPCIDNEDQFKEIEQIALLFAYEDYTSPKVNHEWFLNELFALTHAKMSNKNYEVRVPKGQSLVSWLLRDALRLLGSFRYEVLRQFVLRIPLKERRYMKLKFHDFEKFKSVLSETEWKIMVGQVLNERLEECKAIKTSLVHFKQAAYTEFCMTNAKLAVETFGKAAIAQIYVRVNERNSIRANLIKRGINPSVPLKTILESLCSRNLYAGIHLLPAILKFRPGDLSSIQRMTTIRDNVLIPNDQRFTSTEEYLKFSMSNPMQPADAVRVVDSNLTLEDFPMLGSI